MANTEFTSADAGDAEVPAPAPEPFDQSSGEGQGKASKQQVNYRMGNPMVSCGLCGYFQSKEHKCEAVDEADEPIPGEISAYGFCNIYQKQDNPFLPGRQASFEQTDTEGPEEDATSDEEQEPPRLRIGNRSY